MRTIITYGTFDLFHEGHRRLLERARALGDRLIVGVTTDTYDRLRGKLNVVQPLLDRIENVRQSGLADQILVEEYDGQKIHDIQRWGVDVFAIGSDWLGKFDYLNDYCEVVYLDRTRGVSSTQLRTESSGILRMGLAGAGVAAQSIVEEARFVSGVSVEAVWAPENGAARSLADRMELAWVNDTYVDMLKHLDVVHISAPVHIRTKLIRQALDRRVHVLCEPPLTLSGPTTSALLTLARKRGVVLMEGLRTAYSPGFSRMVAYARSGSIGRIRSVEVRCTHLGDPGEGSIAKLAAYPLMAVVKLLGTDYQDVSCKVLMGDEVDVFARISVHYKDASASVHVGTGLRSENDLVVSGSSGHLYVPDPWWMTDHFETRFADARRNQRFFVPFEGDGHRYELAEFAGRIHGSAKRSYELSDDETITIAEIIERAGATGT